MQFDSHEDSYWVDATSKLNIHEERARVSASLVLNIKKRSTSVGLTLKLFALLALG